VPSIDELLELLEDGKWHGLNEIIEKSLLCKSKAEIIIDFLAEYAFIQLDKECQEARLTPSALNFLKKIQRIEEQEHQQSREINS